MSTVIDLQQIVAGRTNDKGRVYFSFLGENPITGTKIDIYADPLFVKKINPDNDGGHKLGANGLIIDLATGLTYRTAYVQTPGYSVQMLDSFGVPLFNPYRQVGAEATTDNLPLPYETLLIDPAFDGSNNRYRIDKNLLPGLTGQTNVAVGILSFFSKNDVIFELGSDLWNDIPEGGQIHFYLYNSLLAFGLSSGIAFEITPGEEFGVLNPDGYKLAFNENYLPAFNITSDLGQVVTVTKIISNNFLLTGDLDPINPAVSEAPIDGNSYVRKDGAWEVASGGGSGVPNVIDARTLPSYTAIPNPSNPNTVVYMNGGDFELDDALLYTEGERFRLICTASSVNAIVNIVVNPGATVINIGPYTGINGYDVFADDGVNAVDFQVFNGEWFMSGDVGNFPP